MQFVDLACPSSQFWQQNRGHMCHLQVYSSQTSEDKILPVTSHLGVVLTGNVLFHPRVGELCQVK